jgi:hypothetical protein
MRRGLCRNYFLGCEQKNWLDSVGRGRYVRRMAPRTAEFERRYWHLARERGKGRFILREMLGAFLQWAVLATAFLLFRDRPFTLQSIVLVDVVLLPVFLLWGYLNAGWKWNELEKKFPD